MFAYDALKQLAQRRVFRLGTSAVVIVAILLGVVGVTSAANAMLPPAGHGYHVVKPSLGVALQDRQAACAWCGGAAHNSLDDVVVATSASGDVLESVDVRLKLSRDSRGVALMARIFAPPPPLPASFKPRGPPFPA